MFLTATHELLTQIQYAQIFNPTPETPPVADKLLELVRYFTWFVLLSGVLGITYAGGRFAWEKWTGGGVQAPKQVAEGAHRRDRGDERGDHHECGDRAVNCCLAGLSETKPNRRI